MAFLRANVQSFDSFPPPPLSAASLALFSPSPSVGTAQSEASLPRFIACRLLLVVGGFLLCTTKPSQSVRGEFVIHHSQTERSELEFTRTGSSHHTTYLTTATKRLSSPFPNSPSTFSVGLPTPLAQMGPRPRASQSGSLKQACFHGSLHISPVSLSSSGPLPSSRVSKQATAEDFFRTVMVAIFHLKAAERSPLCAA